MNSFRTFLLAAALFSNSSFAAVTAIHIVERTDVLDGAPMGKAGPYERLIARAYFAVDPKLPANRAISDIALAPVNEKGLVEFSADLYVLKPRDSAKGNGTLFFEVSNRGGKGLMGTYNGAAGSRDPRTQAQFGDKFLLDEGFTLAWLGWEFDIADGPGVVKLNAPSLNGVKGPVRTNFTAAKRTDSVAIGAYPVSDASTAVLTVRKRVEDKPVAIAREKWKLRDASHVSLDGGFEPGKIYEIVHTSTDPVLAGLGFAAVRDFVSFIKQGTPATLLSDQPRHIKRAIATGQSQSGRFLRTFLYQGFNASENGKIVFDGMIPTIAGGGLGGFNHRFVQPTRTGFPFSGFLYPVDLFPFTDTDETDPVTGITDGLLHAATKTNAVPKIFYINGSCEYWGRVAPLLHITPDGKADQTLAPGTRIYFMTGTPHGHGAFPPNRGGARYTSNPNSYRLQMRALLLAMNAWIKDGAAPPDSRYPKIANGELVLLSSLRFPQIPGVTVATRPRLAWHLDFGPEFASRGIISIEPPKMGKPFPLPVPQVDSDGNELGGVRTPELAVPLGTYTGWNLGTEASGAPDEITVSSGGWFPFAVTKAARLASSDPRPSIEERYKDRGDYLAKLRAAAETQVRDGLLLERDIPAVLERGEKQWAYLVK